MKKLYTHSFEITLQDLGQVVKDEKIGPLATRLDVADRILEKEFDSKFKKYRLEDKTYDVVHIIQFSRPLRPLAEMDYMDAIEFVRNEFGLKRKLPSRNHHYGNAITLGLPGASLNFYKGALIAHVDGSIDPLQQLRLGVVFNELYAEPQPVGPAPIVMKGDKLIWVPPTSDLLIEPK